MRKSIFLTNDDGVYSEGLQVLHEHLSHYGNLCTVVPETEKSAVAHAINLFTPLKIRHIKKGMKFTPYIVNGTPVDCVKIGVNHILKKPPDMVVSGINPCANMGMDVLYSGTVSAAAEGAILGIPSIAVSLAGHKKFHFNSAASVTLEIINALEGIRFPKDTILNINIPDLPLAEIQGIKLTCQSEARFKEEYEERRDPRGGSYFWLKGIFQEIDGEKGSDVEALKNGYVSITPLYLNLTHKTFLSALKKKKLEDILLKR